MCGPFKNLHRLYLFLCVQHQRWKEEKEEKQGEKKKDKDQPKVAEEKDGQKEMKDTEVNERGKVRGIEITTSCGGVKLKLN